MRFWTIVLVYTCGFLFSAYSLVQNYSLKATAFSLFSKMQYNILEMFYAN